MEGKIKRRQLAGTNERYGEYAFDSFLDTMEGLGVAGVFLSDGTPHFSCEQLSYSECTQLRRDAEKRGLSIVGLGAKGKHSDCRLTEEDPEKRRRSVRYFKKSIQVCREMGIPCMTVSFTPDRGQHGSGAWERAKDMLWCLCEEGQAQGVTIAAGDLGFSKSSSGTLADLIKMDHELNHPGFRILADTGAGDCDGKRLGDWFSAFGDTLCIMQLSWKEGQIHGRETAACAARHGYAGALVLRYLGEKYSAEPARADKIILEMLEPFME